MGLKLSERSRKEAPPVKSAVGKFNIEKYGIPEAVLNNPLLLKTWNEGVAASKGIGQNKIAATVTPTPQQ